MTCLSNLSINLRTNVFLLLSWQDPGAYLTRSHWFSCQLLPNFLLLSLSHTLSSGGINFDNFFPLSELVYCMCMYACVCTCHLVKIRVLFVSSSGCNLTSAVYCFTLTTLRSLGQTPTPPTPVTSVISLWTNYWRFPKKQKNCPKKIVFDPTDCALEPDVQLDQDLGRTHCKIAPSLPIALLVPPLHTHTHTHILKCLDMQKVD